MGWTLIASNEIYSTGQLWLHVSNLVCTLGRPSRTKDWKDKQCQSWGAIPLKYLNSRANVDYGYLYLKEMNISLVRSYGTAGSMVSCIHMQIFTAIFFKE